MLRKIKYTERNYIRLQEISKDYKIPITKIVNMIINDKFNEEINLLSDNENDKNYEVSSFLISEKEKDFLIEESKKSGAISLVSEIKYRLLNTMYKNKFYTNNELTNLSKLRNDVNKLGSNFAYILKKINFKDEVSKDEILKMADDYKQLKIEIENIKNEINEIIEFNKSRN